MHTIRSLHRDFADSGLRRSDTILIHSSMRSLGDIEGRAEGFLRALAEYFSEGLVAFPTLSWDLVNASQPVYSVRDTPCTTGLLPELFRSYPGVRRSLHPTHSIAALGKEAEDFLAGHELFDSPAHRNSPWGKLYDRRAKILFIGTTLACNTFLHGVEEWLPVPGMLTEDAENLVVFDYDSRRIEVPSRRHAGDHSQYYHLMEKRFADAGGLKYSVIGDAEVRILDAVTAGNVTFDLLSLHPLFFTGEFQNKQS
ncbi:MAG: AAC(3) family N-acetyltransferase [Lentisphaeria bacterium]|nr:AAC(3) family N-acetyltransferase [Lentisphaeria bacterium]